MIYLNYIIFQLELTVHIQTQKKSSNLFRSLMSLLIANHLSVTQSSWMFVQLKLYNILLNEVLELLHYNIKKYILE